MGTEFVVVTTPETLVVVSEGAQGPTGPQGQPGDNDSPSFVGPILFTLLGTENVRIDARTNPREVTLGVLRIEHTAGIAGTRPITLNVDPNGFGDTHGFVLDYNATNITSGESHLFEVNIDTSNSTGGSIEAFTVSKSGTGTSTISALEVYPGIDVIKQKTGDPISLTQAWLLSGSTYTDATTYFDTGASLAIFSLDNDYIICGSDAAFNQIEVYLQTLAGLNISPIFSYSTGAGTWQTFSPADGTTGFTRNGTIAWDSGSLAGWISATVNGIAKYYIRIQRITNNIGTVPIELSIRVNSTTDYGWSRDADISVRSISASLIPTYADRTAALAGGLTTGQFYQTSAGALMIV